ncbi:MAG: hypothetical protein JWN86_1460 [Planctomycetota bacterium]|nr:hypothetical protein [Planctomycetota bacterium]
MHLQRIVGRLFRGGLMLMPVLLASSAAPARADFVLEALNVGPLAVGSSGSFVVILTDTATPPTGPFDVNAFNVQLTLDAGSGITFTGADIGAVTANFIFDGITQFSPGFQANVANGGLQIDFDDLGDMPSDSRTFNSSGGPISWVLGRVFFTIAPDASAGTSIVTVTQYSDVTSPDGDSFKNPPTSLTLINGSITTVTAVPEPSSLILTGLGAGCIVVSLRRRHRAAVT